MKRSFTNLRLRKWTLSCELILLLSILQSSSSFAGNNSLNAGEESIAERDSRLRPRDFTLRALGENKASPSDLPVFFKGDITYDGRAFGTLTDTFVAPIDLPFKAGARQVFDTPQGRLEYENTPNSNLLIYRNVDASVVGPFPELASYVDKGYQLVFFESNHVKGQANNTFWKGEGIFGAITNVEVRCVFLADATGHIIKALACLYHFY